MNRRVHVADDFLLDAMRQFGRERSPQGQPSINDFFETDLDTIIFTFANMWPSLDQWQNHPNYRFRYIQGRIAYVYYVVGEEHPDGSIELIQLDVDHNWP